MKSGSVTNAAVLGFSALVAAACARGPVELGFWFEPVAYSSPRIGGPMSPAELATIESVARSEIDALGRGVGRVAIHEFLHQLLPKAPIHDSRDTRSYEGNSPALVEGYFGDLHWDIAEPWVRSRLAPR